MITCGFLGRTGCLVYPVECVPQDGVLRDLHFGDRGSIFSFVCTRAEEGQLYNFEQDCSPGLQARSQRVCLIYG